MTTNQPPLHHAPRLFLPVKKYSRDHTTEDAMLDFSVPHNWSFHFTRPVTFVMSLSIMDYRHQKVPECVYVCVLCNQRILTSQFFPFTSTNLEALMLALFNRLWGLLLGLLGPFCNAGAFWLVHSAFSIPSDIGGLWRVAREADAALHFLLSPFWLGTLSLKEWRVTISREKMIKPNKLHNH